jgi:tRNA(Arg) A34 adenosine deaminase TadA
VVIPERFEIELPSWIPELLADRPVAYPSLAGQMDLVVELAREHVERGTGGPFAAGVFTRSTGRLVAVGVNLVVPAMACIAHAEMVAFALAGPALGSFHLGNTGQTALVTSTEPCAMCLGAVGWSGVSLVAFGAFDEDARASGFDEGHKPPDWRTVLAARGVAVRAGVAREAARDVLRLYTANGGHVYNGTAVI